MPPYIKNIILEKYKDTNIPWIKKAMEYMISQEPKESKWEFPDYNITLDNIRKENFKTTFPEWYEVIKTYWKRKHE